MLTSDGKYSWGAVCFGRLFAVVLLGLFYLHVWLIINPALVYEIRCPVFLTSLGFFKSFLPRPGGLVEYLSIFCSQFNYYPWAGALIITLTAGLICLATRGVLRAMGTGRGAAAWLDRWVSGIAYHRWCAGSDFRGGPTN